MCLMVLGCVQLIGPVDLVTQHIMAGVQSSKGSSVALLARDQAFSILTFGATEDQDDCRGQGRSSCLVWTKASAGQGRFCLSMPTDLREL